MAVQGGTVRLLLPSILQCFVTWVHALTLTFGYTQPSIFCSTRGVLLA